MKNILTLILTLFYVVVGFTQAKKPTLMILPSDNWCEQRFFMTNFENQGKTQKVPNYKQAFQEDTELGQVISKIGGLMQDRGFELVDAEQELKNIEARTSEDYMTRSKNSNSEFAETPLDMLKRTAKADIIIQIWWKVNKINGKKSISFTLDALDAYTGKRIASSTGNGQPSDEIVPVLLLNAVNSHINEFLNRLQLHFNDLMTKGREVVIFIRTWDNWEYSLEEEFNDEELIDIIDEWMAKNTVDKRYNMVDATETFIQFRQVRIPLFDNKGRPIDARKFTNKLRKFLKTEPYNITSKLMTRGLGEAILVLGEK